MLLKVLSSVICSIIIIIHLVLCFLEKDKLRKITKCFCVTSFVFVFLSFGITNIFIYLALVFGIIGDLCLIFKDNKKILTLGMVAFGINHIFYYIVAFIKLENVGWQAYLVASIFFIMLCAMFYIGGRKYFKEMTIPSSIYSSSLGTETLVMVLFLIFSKNDYNYSLFFLPLIGNLIFISSDLYLAKTLFIKHDKREDFYIMITYLLGQFILALGLGLF